MLSDLPLRSFTLNFNYTDPLNQYHTPPSALRPLLPSTDHLSLALHTMSLSSSLTSLTIKSCIISPDLYWPTNQTPTWPNLRRFYVGFNMTTPNGDWYFIRTPKKPMDEGEENDEDGSVSSCSDIDSDASSSDSRNQERYVGDCPVCLFRSLRSDLHINPLLLAVARAAADMPQLQGMSLKAYTSDPKCRPFDVQFCAPMNLCSHDVKSDYEDVARLYWAVGSSWRPDDEILDVWRNGKEGLLIKYVD
ncbi:MAG: hypothetical protein L6R41_006445 [Letrouitia leprolyta]|nr:MAG: hypothetical protein L6R41_006445 [Letrouitia leprolyta]